MLVLADSQSGISLAQNESINRRNKHINMQFHYVRDVVDRKLVNLGYVPTGEMIADMTNKPLGWVRFEKFRRIAGLVIKGNTYNDVIKGECWIMWYVVLTSVPSWSKYKVGPLTEIIEPSATLCCSGKFDVNFE